MPGERWLQLHIHEMHDILVKIRRERGERTYQCFVAHCQHAFKSTHGRRLHLIDRHKYSQSFNFDIVKEGALSFEKRIKKLGIKRAYRSTTSSLRRDSVTSNGSMDLEHVSSSSSRETSPLPDSHSADTTQRRRASSPSLGSIHQQQQQQKKPQLSHDDHKGTSAKASDGMDMEIDQLQATLSRLTLPKTKAKNHGHTDRPRLQPGFYRGPPIGQHHHLEHSAQQAKPAPDSTAGPVPIATSRVNTWMVPRQVKATATKPLPSKPTRAPVLQDVHME
ncbi:hypothetical protein DFQ27_004795 [Actinomortierella ambigua]|uniref:C2H2-type domain-containing protein n=1 Tax=Actinomortierella ambigua TaxID=1343610 RepID=A0A9P6Q469_9FUNG|nr:hypothetical protein DFQ27_004795 [Actinomortierella ambigua]